MVGSSKLTSSPAAPRYDSHVRIPWLTSVLIGLVTALAFSTPALGADPDSLSVRITSLSPTVLTGDTTITLTGTASNPSKSPWTSVHAYLVMPKRPYTNRVQLQDALASDSAYVGERIVDTDRFAIIGDLEPGEEREFTIRVPSKEIGLSHADGVFPVGVHLVATNSRGERNPQSQARDVTLLPSINSDVPSVKTTLVWPFVETWPIDKVNPKEIAQSVTGGQLQRYLEAAKATPVSSRTLLIDPALLDSLEAIADDAEAHDIDADVAQAMRVWNADLVALSQKSDTWIVGYARPDFLGFFSSAGAPRITDVIQKSTQEAAERHKISGKTVVWPAQGDSTAALLNFVAGNKTDLAIVAPTRLNNWSQTDGSVVSTQTGSSAQPLLAASPLRLVHAQADTSFFVQHTLSTATLSSLELAGNPKARSDAVTLVNPRWDPQVDQLKPLLSLLSAENASSFLSPVTLGASVTAPQSSVSVKKTTSAKSFPKERSHLTAQLESISSLVSDVNLEPGASLENDRQVARSVALRWRGENAAVQSGIAKAIQDKQAFLGKITLEAPATITLSGQEGAFPLTIRNGTGAPIRVSLTLEADVAGITFAKAPVVRVEPGSSYTMTVSANLGSQVAATMTAQLTSETGTAFGKPSAFVLRSSNVGQFVWIAMAAAMLLVVAAGIRRFLRRRNTGTDTPPSTESDDRG